MAVLALGLIGGALGGGIGGALGLSAAGVAIAAGAGQAVLGAVGSYVDSTILFPALFGRDNPNQTGPKIGDLQLTTASPGSPVYYVLGRNNRVPGMIVWMSKVKKVKEETDEGGGKMGGSATVVKYKFYVSVAIALCDGPISAVRKIWANGKVIYDNTGPKPKTYPHYKSITIYPGTTTQLPDPVIEGFDGVGNVPAYRGTAYLVLERFGLHHFGDRFPNFNFLVEQEPQTLVSEAFDKVLSRANRPLAEFDTTFLRGEELQGYTVAGPMSAVKQLEPLMTAFDVVAQEYDGIIHFRKRKDVPTTAIDYNNLAAHEEGNDTDRKFTVQVTPGFDLPKEIDIQYLDPHFDNQKSSQTSQRIHAVGPTTSSFDLPIVMTASDARSLARRLLWGSWAERNSVNLQLPPSMLTILESDCLTFTDVNSNDWRLRVTKVTRGGNYLVVVEAVTEQAQTLTATALASPPPGSGGDTTTDNEVTLPQTLLVSGFDTLTCIGVQTGVNPWDGIIQKDAVEKNYFFVNLVPAVKTKIGPDDVWMAVCLLDYKDALTHAGVAGWELALRGFSSLLTGEYQTLWRGELPGENPKGIYNRNLTDSDTCAPAPNTLEVS